MKKNKKTRMFNFLIELLLVIVIFAISSIVVVKMFYNGYALNKENKELNDAMFVASDIAEQMRLYNGESLDEYLVYQAKPEYDVTVEIAKECEHYCLYSSNIKVKKNDKVLVEFNVKSVGEAYE